MSEIPWGSSATAARGLSWVSTMKLRENDDGTRIRIYQGPDLDLPQGLHLKQARYWYFDDQLILVLAVARCGVRCVALVRDDAGPPDRVDPGPAGAELPPGDPEMLQDWTWGPNTLSVRTLSPYPTLFSLGHEGIATHDLNEYTFTEEAAGGPLTFR